MTEGFTAMTILAICIMILGMGFALGEKSAADDCKTFGKFTANGAVYSCAPSQPEYAK